MYRYCSCCLCMWWEGGSAGLLGARAIHACVCVSRSSLWCCPFNLLQLQRSVPEGEAVRGFKGPVDLAAIFAQTRLAFHPCEYDAYGMAVIEAASHGAPSAMQCVRP